MSAKAQVKKSHKFVLGETEKIIDAALAIMDELPYSSDGYVFAEQIRELADKIDDYVNGQ